MDPRGHPNQLTVFFNQPVSPQTATNRTHYSLRTAGNVELPIAEASLDDDLTTVRLNGAFTFTPGANYTLTVSDVADILEPGNVVSPVTLPFTFTTGGPVNISSDSDLSDRQVVENSDVSFKVLTTGQAPFFYQWNFNGAPIPGETGPQLTFTAPITSAGQYSVTLRNEFSELTTRAATLTILPDTTPPRLSDVRALAGSLNEFRLTFSEPILSATGTNLANYHLDPPGLSLLSANISEDGRQVTIKTSVQISGQTNHLIVTGLLDRAAQPNSLSQDATLVSGVSYRDEIIADGAVRYWTFGETTGTNIYTLVSQFDTAPESLIGKAVDGARLGVPGLVPNAGTDTAIAFDSASVSNRVDVPNGRDINAILGPWSKRTHIFSFRADTLPRLVLTTNTVDGQPVVTTNAIAPALYAHDRIAFYLYGTQQSDNPTEAQLVFRAHNTTSEGPGSPWGGTTLETSKHVITTIRAGQVYHIVGVLDGAPTTFNGQLKLYVNGELVGAVGGIGQVYKHPNTTPSFGQGSFRKHDGVSQSLDPTADNFNARFDGVIDEFSLINKALPAARIAQLFAFAQLPPAAPSIIPQNSVFTSLRVEEGQLILTWEGSAVLESGNTLHGPFVQVPNATSPHREPFQGSQRYFRLQP